MTGQRIRVLHNEKNRGKGFSLRRGFKEAIRLGYRNAISIDSDGQHLPDDIPLFVEAAGKNPGALLCTAYHSLHFHDNFINSIRIKLNYAICHLI